jgi:hypothetical protein
MRESCVLVIRTCQVAGLWFVENERRHHEAWVLHLSGGDSGLALWCVVNHGLVSAK